MATYTGTSGVSYTDAEIQDYVMNSGVSPEQLYADMQTQGFTTAQLDAAMTGTSGWGGDTAAQDWEAQYLADQQTSTVPNTTDFGGYSQSYLDSIGAGDTTTSTTGGVETITDAPAPSEVDTSYQQFLQSAETPGSPTDIEIFEWYQDSGFSPEQITAETGIDANDWLGGFKATDEYKNNYAETTGADRQTYTFSNADIKTFTEESFASDPTGSSLYGDYTQYGLSPEQLSTATGWSLEDTTKWVNEMQMTNGGQTSTVPAPGSGDYIYQLEGGGTVSTADIRDTYTNLINSGQDPMDFYQYLVNKNLHPNILDHAMGWPEGSTEEYIRLNQISNDGSTSSETGWNVEGVLGSGQRDKPTYTPMDEADAIQQRLIAEGEKIRGLNTTTNPLDFQDRQAETYDAETAQLVSERQAQLLEDGSPYIDAARMRAREQAGESGLLMSSMAIGAGELAAIESSFNIAKADVDTMLANSKMTNEARFRNVSAVNDFIDKNVGDHNEVEMAKALEMLKMNSKFTEAEIIQWAADKDLAREDYKADLTDWYSERGDYRAAYYKKLSDDRAAKAANELQAITNIGAERASMFQAQGSLYAALNETIGRIYASEMGELAKKAHVADAISRVNAISATLRSLSQ